MPHNNNKNRPQKTHIIVEGASVSCSLGTQSQSKIKVKHKNSEKYLANNKPIVTWLEDSKEHMLFANCTRNPNTPPPCTPKIKWKNYYDNAEFGNQKVLTEISEGICTYGGKVKIIDHGQKIKPSSKRYNENLNTNYDLFMINPTLGNRKDKGLPSVFEINLIAPTAYPITKNKEVAFDLKGNIQEVTLQATKVKGNKNLISWVLYSDDKQENRIKTYLEYGSTLSLKLQDLPLGKTTIFGYGKTPVGEQTKIIINRTKNKLEKIKGNTQTAKYTPIVINPEYSFPIHKNLSTLNEINKTNSIWRVLKENTIVYSSNFPTQKEKLYKAGISVVHTKDKALILAFSNSGKFKVEFTDYSLIESPIEQPTTKSLEITVKDRKVDSIQNKGKDRIRKTDAIHLLCTGIQFPYGELSVIGIGNRAHWYVKKDNGSFIYLDFKENLSLTVEQLIQKFKQSKILSAEQSFELERNPYGEYTFRAFGEKKAISEIQSLPHTESVVITLTRNRVESIEGPPIIPVGAKVKYKMRALMPLNFDEKVRWNKPTGFCKLEPADSEEEIWVRTTQPEEIKLNVRLEGGETNDTPLGNFFVVKASKTTLCKAFWGYSNGKIKTESGWNEENFLYLSIEGLKNTSVFLNVWVQHPRKSKEESINIPECLIRKIPSQLDEQGNCKVSFITDEECKEKLNFFFDTIHASLFFTLEFPPSQTTDLSRIKIISQKNAKEYLEEIEAEGKNQYIILEPYEVLKIPAQARITAINFSNEMQTDIQVVPTEFGKTHTIWIHTTGMTNEKLTAKVYKCLLPENMLDTYNEKNQSFLSAIEVENFPNQIVGKENLLTLPFTPKDTNNDANGKPQVFFVKVFTEKNEDEEASYLKEVGTQVKNLHSLPYYEVLNKDCSQVGIKMSPPQERQPTADQLKEVVRSFFHFYNPLLVSKTGTIENQEVISPVLVERGDNSKQECECVGFNLIWGMKLSCEERKKVVQVSANIWGEDKKLEKANELMAILHLESEFNPKADNGKGYVGLIQFSKETALSLETTQQELKQMSFVKQMDYVEKYLILKKDKLQTLVDFYLQILKPSDVGQGSNPKHIVFDESISVPDGDGKNTPLEQRMENISREPWVTKYGYSSNPSFMLEKEGNIQEYSQRKKWVYTRQRMENRWGIHGGKTYIWEIEEVLKKTHYLPGKASVFRESCKNTPEEEPITSPNLSNRAPWMEIAWNEEKKNLKETGNNKEIQKFFQGTAYEKAMKNGEKNESQISWCAAFVNWVMQNYGYNGISSSQGYDALRALKWAEWENGKKLIKPIYGAIAVKKRKGGGHVGFVAGKKGNKIVILGGNQSNSLNTSLYNINDFFAYIIPKDYEVLESDYDLLEYNGNTSRKGSEL